MSKYKIINLFDKIFISICVFLLMYAWINFFLRDLWTTFFVSLIFSSACLFVLFYLSNKKQSKIATNKKLQQEIENNFLAFRLMRLNDKISLMKKIISRTSECKSKSGSILFSNDEKKCQLFILANTTKIDEDILFQVIEKTEKDVESLWIVCATKPNVYNEKILKDLEIKFIDKSELYKDFFLKNSLFPKTENLTTFKEKFSFKTVVKNLITPAKTKTYFWCGLVLIFSSIILPYRTYYLIFGSLFLIFSILCKLQPLFKR